MVAPSARYHCVSGDAMLVSVLAYAGLRPEEARALRWEDLGERTIRVERAAAGSTVKETKTDEIRTVRLLEPLASDLALWRERCGGLASGLVFPTSRGTVWTDFDWRNWRRRVYRPTVAINATPAECARIAEQFGCTSYDVTGPSCGLTACATCEGL